MGMDRKSEQRCTELDVQRDIQIYDCIYAVCVCVERNGDLGIGK